MARQKRIKKIARYPALPTRWRALITKGEPFIVTGGARSRLTLALVAELGTSTEIVVKNQATGDVGQATLSELVGCLDQDDAIWYMAQHAVPACLDGHFPLRPITGVAGLRKPNIWLGSTRAFTHLHQDVLHNCLLQLDGKKLFTVFAPQDDVYLYREPTVVRPNYSQIKLTSAVDAKQFPDFRKATPFLVELGPGDLFMLPAFWWHEVLTRESSLMLNYWFAPALEAVDGIDVERHIFSSAIARRHVLKHFDLTSMKSDHGLVEALVRQKLGLLAAVVLGDMGDEFLGRLSAKHRFDPRLYPATCEALLKTKGKLPSGAADLLKEIRDEAATADTFLRSKAPAPALNTAALNQRLRRLCSASRVPGCSQMVQNNRAWMKDVSADSYLF